MIRPLSYHHTMPMKAHTSACGRSIKRHKQYGDTCKEAATLIDSMMYHLVFYSIFGRQLTVLRGHWQSPHFISAAAEMIALAGCADGAPVGDYARGARAYMSAEDRRYADGYRLWRKALLISNRAAAAACAGDSSGFAHHGCMTSSSCVIFDAAHYPGTEMARAGLWRQWYRLMTDALR